MPVFGKRLIAVVDIQFVPVSQQPGDGALAGAGRASHPKGVGKIVPGVAVNGTHRAPLLSGLTEHVAQCSFVQHRHTQFLRLGQL